MRSVTIVTRETARNCEAGRTDMRNQRKRINANVYGDVCQIQMSRYVLLK